MERTAVFSGRSAGKGKGRGWAGVLPLPQMAVAGPADVLVGVSGCILLRTSRSSFGAEGDVSVGGEAATTK